MDLSGGRREALKLVDFFCAKLQKSSSKTGTSRDEYYQKRAQDQMQAVDNNFMRENDPRMPVFAPDRKTNVTFGGGR
jgi:hypothetical protein